VVNKLINAGTKLICEASLVESDWTGLAGQDASRLDAAYLEEHYKVFLGEWQKLYKVSPDFKVVVTDLQVLLSELRLWLDELEMSVSTMPATDRAALERELIPSLQAKVNTAIGGLTERFEDTLNRVQADLIPLHRAFCRRMMNPITMCSPFMRRAFQKPLGYAGDYEMVNMMFRSPFEGDSLFAKLVNCYALQLPPIVGHRNRIKFLVGRLQTEALRLNGLRRETRVFSIGCGPAQEIQQFMAASNLSNFLDCTLVDFSAETLERTAQVLQGLKWQYSRATRIKTIKKSAQQLIRPEGRSEANGKPERYDFMYCAGLFDYLTDYLCRQILEVCYAKLAPGGLLIATNVDEHPARHQMECFLDWHLIHRNTGQMLAVAPAGVPPDNILLKRDPSGVNVFLEIRKPDDE
jgi:extracellular factor (EF) 3-hydroxypalmitic acid methyl ester biosynthesis protein